MDLTWEMTMRRVRLQTLTTALAVGALTLVAAGCGDDDEDSNAAPATATTQTTTAAASDTVGVEASEMKFVLTSDSAPAGKVTFNAKNVGKVDHEMVVVKTETPAGKLPVTDGEVDETGAIGEIGPEELTVGASPSLTLDMKSGHYALICALPGHYAAGMYADFEVE